MFEILAILTGAVAAAFLGPIMFSGGEPEDSPRLETLEGSRAVVVPAAADVSHQLWVKTRGELWRANFDGPMPSPGSVVEVRSVDGLILDVTLAPKITPAKPKTAWWKSISNTKFALGFWAVSCAFCWIAVGSPFYSLVGVPGIWVFALGSLSAVDS